MKKKRIRLLALVLAALLVLTGCSSPYEGKTTSGVLYYTFSTASYYKDASGKEVGVDGFIEDLPARDLLDVQSIYNSITYDERMLYGHYCLYDEDADVKKLLKTAAFMDIEINGIYSYTVTATQLPVDIQMGLNDVYAARYLRDAELAYLKFARESGDGYIYLNCVYTVSGNTVTFTVLDSLDPIYDEAYHIVGYEYTVGTQELTYTFAFDGPRITLSNDSGSITLISYAFRNDGQPRVGGYLATGSDTFDGLDHFNGSLFDELFDHSTSSYLVMQDESYARYSAIRLYDDGIVDFYWVQKDDDGNETTHHKTLVYFGTSPMVLTDGENVYYFSEGYMSRNTSLMSESLSQEDMVEFESMNEDQQQVIVQKKASLLNDLSAAFAEAGLNVEIDAVSGEITLDCAILFAVNESTLSPEGQAFLREFLQVYTGVVFSDDYTDFVSKIMIEGHTDTSGSYDYNLTLSQARADSVLAYCLSEDSGVDPAYSGTLAQLLEAVGYSCDDPVYDAEGNVDMDASRRVSFRFLINIGS